MKMNDHSSEDEKGEKRATTQCNDRSDRRRTNVRNMLNDKKVTNVNRLICLNNFASIMFVQ